MLKKLITSATLSAALLVAAAAQAAIIYNGGGPNQAGGQTADAATSTPLAAESFDLFPFNNTITDVHWWGLCGIARTCPTSNFEIAFYTNNSGIPGTLVKSYSVGNANQTATGVLIDRVFTEYSYSTDISALTLTAGDLYWLVIGNDLGPDAPADAKWVWESTNGSGDHLAFLTGTGWIASPPDLAFYLTIGEGAAIPEPASFALLGSGLLGFAVARRHKKPG